MPLLLPTIDELPQLSWPQRDALAARVPEIKTLCELIAPRWSDTRRTCEIERCQRRMRSRGMCAMHYERWRRHGDALVFEDDFDPAQVRADARLILARLGYDPDAAQHLADLDSRARRTA